MPSQAIAGTATRLVALAVIIAVVPVPVCAAWIWVEGEKPARSSMHRHPYWYDQVKREFLSAGDFMSNSDERPGEAAYRFTTPAAGTYAFWVRANPIQAKLLYRLNDGAWTPIDVARGVDSTNIAADGKPDLRFLAWAKAGDVPLKQGPNTIEFRMEGPNHNHGYIDCFVFANEPFTPRGSIRPDQAAEAARRTAEANKGWFPFDPKRDAFRSSSAIDLRDLNEKNAGDGGFIGVKGSQFVHSKTGVSVRFWAVNGPASQNAEDLRREARNLAKHGVNLARVHHAYFANQGSVDAKSVRHALDVVAALKAEGIYTHFSIYFPLWLRPRPDTSWLKGYDGQTVPFAALMFNRDFQREYEQWWKALLLTPDPSTGKRLVDEPAVAGVEIQNEDSYFFWTFDPNKIPDPQMRILEAQFGDWLKRRYGSLDAALRAWGGRTVPRDRPAEGRVSFRPLWNMVHEKTPRDRDAARFLVDSQRAFYKQTYEFLRGLGFQGVITASNWATASPEVLGPLEKYTYTIGDFIDRHGYFGCGTKGEAAEWSVRDRHTYADRSALRFESEEPGKPKVFSHPVMDPSYNGKPSMISETTFNRPNRYRSEAPVFYAVYGALQGSDAIVHFADDSADWSVKPGYFMQPWTLMSPAMMGQFPAAALIYRKGLVTTGDLLVDLNLKVDDLLDLRGTPLPQDAALDELRLKDVPKGTVLRPGNVIDPLVHFAGRTNVNFTDRGGPATLKSLAGLVNRPRERVSSSTGELRLDYGKGLLTIDAPAAQGASGALREGKTMKLRDLTIESPLALGHVVAVSLDGQPLATSQRILLQAMSEEKAAGFHAEPAASGMQRITSIGHDPWLVKEIQGTIQFHRADASRLTVTALDFNGEPVRRVGAANEIRLAPDVIYYLISQ